MNKNPKYIGLNQRLPFSVLDSSINSYLSEGVTNKKYITESMQEFTPGINRANKAANSIIQIIKKHDYILKQFKNYLNEINYASLRIDDRKAFCLCLISMTYPIAYNLLIALAQGFKVQNQINKKFINEKVMSIYGSNRSVDIAIDALLPMIIELNTIKRDKVSIYSLASKLIIKNKFIYELIIYSDIKLSETKSILIDDLNHKPWYSFFDFPLITKNQFNLLISVKDGAVGKGYLTLK